MKYEIAGLVLLLTLMSVTSIVTADVITRGLPVTIVIGNVPINSTNSSNSTQSNITINNPANISFQVVARDINFLPKQNVTVTLFDHEGHDFLSANNFVGTGNLFSASSDVDFELAFDKLDIMVPGTNFT